jgi:pyruvate-formate lyase
MRTRTQITLDTYSTLASLAAIGVNPSESTQERQGKAMSQTSAEQIDAILAENGITMTAAHVPTAFDPKV